MTEFKKVGNFINNQKDSETENSSLELSDKYRKDIQERLGIDSDGLFSRPDGSLAGLLIFQQNGKK